jgi:hypothetical protein
VHFCRAERHTVQPFHDLDLFFACFGGIEYWQPAMLAEGENITQQTPMDPDGNDWIDGFYVACAGNF